MAHRADEVAQGGDQAGVERRRRRPADGVQFGGQLVPAGDGQQWLPLRGSQFLHQRLDAQLVRGVAHAEVARNGERRDFVAVGQNRRARGLLVQRRGFVAVHSMPAAYVDHVARHQLALEAELPDQRRIVADEEQADGAALAFDDGVRRQRG